MRHEAERKPEPPLPVAVIGAGPMGLAAAAHLVAREERPFVLEAGNRVGTSVAAWGHVRMFSPWSELIDPVCRGLLLEEGWEEPDPGAIPTGADLVERLLEPLASHPRIAPHLRLGHRVVGVSRDGRDKLTSAGRGGAPFTLAVSGPDGRLERLSARAVIDASGTYGTPNPLGADGLPVPGEREAAAAGRLRYGIPDLRAERHRYAGRHTLVVGGGHSAYHAVLDLARLAADAPGTRVVWALRRGGAGGKEGPHALEGGRPEDPLPARAALADRVRGLLADGAVELVTGFRTRRLSETGNGLLVAGTVATGERSITADELVVTTGYRPDLQLLRELRLALDPRLESPSRLAPLIDPDLHDCGSVSPHGFEVLRQPERDFFMVGMKSYGRAPSFLLLTGYEQVRSVVAALAGDMEAARRVDLALPAAACSAGGDLPTPDADRSPGAAAACCGPARPPEAVRISASR